MATGVKARANRPPSPWRPSQPLRETTRGSSNPTASASGPRSPTDAPARIVSAALRGTPLDRRTPTPERIATGTPCMLHGLWTKTPCTGATADRLHPTTCRRCHHPAPLHRVFPSVCLSCEERDLLPVFSTYPDVSKTTNPPRAPSSTKLQSSCSAVLSLIRKTRVSFGRY